MRIDAKKVMRLQERWMVTPWWHVKKSWDQAGHVL